MKFIAGDDTLKKEAMVNYISFISNHEECSLLHSSIETYKEKIEDKNKISTNYISLITEKINASVQFKLLCFGNKISAPSVIIKKEIINKLGGFDESIPLCEDWPFWLKATKLGYKFHYLSTSCVNYRIHSCSTFSSTNKQILNQILSKRKYLINISHFIVQRHPKYFVNTSTLSRIFL